MKSEDIIKDKFTIDALLKRAYFYKNSEEYIRFFSFLSRFKHYSRFNTMLVYAQNRAVTFFGGESYWKKKFNRTINANARPYVIIVPGGPVMMVYDILDTDGELPAIEWIEKELGRIIYETDYRFKEVKLDHAINMAKSWGITIQDSEMSLFHYGSINADRAQNKLVIDLNKNQIGLGKLNTLVHELAHLYLGHLGVNKLTNNSGEVQLLLSRRNLSLEARELEAESVSFLILNKLGYETRSAEYLADYIKSENTLLEVNYEIIIKTADFIEKKYLR